MSKKIFLICSVALYILTGTAFANNASPEQLLESFKQAHEHKSFDEFHDLYLWTKIDNSMKEMMEGHIRDFFINKNAVGFSIEPLEENHKTEHVVNGFRYSPNVDLKGYIKITHDHATPPDTTQIPFGAYNNKYYLSNMIKEKLEGDYVQQKQLSVSIIGQPEEEPILFSGTIIYFENGKQEFKNIEGKNNISHSFRADFIQKCSITRNQGRGALQLLIYEDGKQIFESDRSEENEIVYTK